MIILAVDTEEAEVLDCKIANIIAAAKESEIPLLFCLNRRKLGKAIATTVKQAAVAIYDADGAYPEFKKLRLRVEKFEEEQIRKRQQSSISLTVNTK